MVTRNIGEFTVSYSLSQNLKKFSINGITGIHLKRHFLKNKMKEVYVFF